MPCNDAFAPVRRELDQWQAARQEARLWLRDDDAHEPSELLERLLAALRRHGAYGLIAVIPMRTGEPLAARLRVEPLVRVAVHGSRHRNNAPEGRRAEEMALELGLVAVREELAMARARLMSLFGESAGKWYVPPWNRIAPEVARELPDLGFKALSTFADQRFELGERLPELNPHVDFIDWKRGRAGHGASVVAEKLAQALEQARHDGFQPVGVLTHHLAHDETVWAVLDMVLDCVATHPAAGWHDPDLLLRSAGDAV